MSTAEEFLARWVSGARDTDLDQLSNNELRRLAMLLNAMLPAAANRAKAARKARRTATFDVAGYSFTVSYEILGVIVGATLPPPFNLLLIGGAAASGGYKLFDGRTKYARLLATWRSGKRLKIETGRLTRLAEQLEREVQLRVTTKRWP